MSNQHAVSTDFHELLRDGLILQVTVIDGQLSRLTWSQPILACVAFIMYAFSLNVHL